VSSKTAVIVGVIAALGIVAGIASAAPGHNTIGQRRLTGPFCINEHTGVVRSVAATRACRAGEVRKYGVPVSGGIGINGTNGQLGPQGPAGPAGAKGETGAQGVAGGPGARGDTGAQGEAGPAGPTGAKGDNGPTGATGDTGAQGPAGPAGPQGAAGTSGLGNGTITLCVSNGNDVKFGGPNGELCNAGHDIVLKVVVVN
jgi:Collagen triple helix repeat (20 copies)